MPRKFYAIEKVKTVMQSSSTQYAMKFWAIVKEVSEGGLMDSGICC